jgi:hypothetical protein
MNANPVPSKYRPMSRISKRILGTLLLLLFFSSLSGAAPMIRQIFPARNFLIGQARFWIIEIRYPVWESFSLHAKEIHGATISVKEKNVELNQGEMKVIYRLKIVPTDLIVPEVPSVTISGARGESIVLNGHPIVVQSISGNSMEIQQARAPVFQSRVSNQSLLIYGALLFILTTAEAFLIWRRKRAALPKQVILRQLKRVLKETSLAPSKYPAALEKLFRSDLLWGFSAEALTPSELFDAAAHHRELKELAETLQYLERYRYSDEISFQSDDRIRKSILTGIEILHRHPQAAWMKPAGNHR